MLGREAGACKIRSNLYQRSEEGEDGFEPGKLNENFCVCRQTCFGAGEAKNSRGKVGKVVPSGCLLGLQVVSFP